jgi:hypothetical protein
LGVLLLLLVLAPAGGAVCGAAGAGSVVVLVGRVDDYSGINNVSTVFRNLTSHDRPLGPRYHYHHSSIPQNCTSVNSFIVTEYTYAHLL